MNMNIGHRLKYWFQPIPELFQFHYHHPSVLCSEPPMMKLLLLGPHFSDSNKYQTEPYFQLLKIQFQHTPTQDSYPTNQYRLYLHCDAKKLSHNFRRLVCNYPKLQNRTPVCHHIDQN